MEWVPTAILVVSLAVTAGAALIAATELVKAWICRWQRNRRIRRRWRL